MKIVFFENFLLFVNALLEIRNYFQQIRYICITTVRRFSLKSNSKIDNNLFFYNTILNNKRFKWKKIFILLSLNNFRETKLPLTILLEYLVELMKQGLSSPLNKEQN